MKSLALVIASAVLAACGTKPPLPPDCQGELVPINPQPTTVAPSVSNEVESSD